MSEDLERIYTINLGKVLLSQSQHRAVRAINMVREFARKHMKVDDVKIDEDLARQIWARGVRSPPRKLRVRIQKIESGTVLVGKYDGPVESETSEDKPAVDTSSTPEVGVVAGTRALPESSTDSTLGEVNLGAGSGDDAREQAEEVRDKEEHLSDEVPSQQAGLVQQESKEQSLDEKDVNEEEEEDVTAPAAEKVEEIAPVSVESDDAAPEEDKPSSGTDDEKQQESKS